MQTRFVTGAARRPSRRTRSGNGREDAPATFLRLWGHASHVAACGSHSAGRRKQERAARRAVQAVASGCVEARLGYGPADGISPGNVWSGPRTRRCGGRGETAIDSAQGIRSCPQLARWRPERLLRRRSARVGEDAARTRSLTNEAPQNVERVFPTDAVRPRPRTRRWQSRGCAARPATRRACDCARTSADSSSACQPIAVG